MLSQWWWYGWDGDYDEDQAGDINVNEDKVWAILTLLSLQARICDWTSRLLV